MAYFDPFSVFQNKYRVIRGIPRIKNLKTGEDQEYLKYITRIPNSSNDPNPKKIAKTDKDPVPGKKDIELDRSVKSIDLVAGQGVEKLEEDLVEKSEKPIDIEPKEAVEEAELFIPVISEGTRNQESDDSEAESTESSESTESTESTVDLCPPPPKKPKLHQFNVAE